MLTLLSTVIESKQLIHFMNWMTPGIYNETFSD